jgi:thymidylate kinase
MIIEFLGNSGAGKSTLIPAVAGLLRDDGLVAMPVTEAIHCYMRKTGVGRLVCFLAPRAWQGPILWRVFSYGLSRLHAARFTMQNLRLVRYVVTTQRRRPIPGQHRRLILRLFFRMIGSYHFLRSRVQPGEVLLIDEGFVHRVVHMFVSASERPAPDQVAAYLKLLPRSDLVVWVQAPLDVCQARISARGLQVRLRGLEAHEVVQFLENAQQVVSIAAQYLKGMGWDVVAVDNGGAPAAAAADLHRSLGQYLSRAALLGRYVVGSRQARTCQVVCAAP